MLESDLSENVLSQNDLTGNEPAGDEPPGDELWVEEAAGNVYPTLANETMSDTYPADGNTISGTSPGGNQTASHDFSETVEVISAGNDQSYYKVQDGETLYGICLKLYGNGSMMDEICEINGLDDENKIISGQKLILP